MNRRSFFVTVLAAIGLAKLLPARAAPDTMCYATVDELAPVTRYDVLYGVATLEHGQWIQARFALEDELTPALERVASDLEGAELFVDGRAYTLGPAYALKGAIDG